MATYGVQVYDAAGRPLVGVGNPCIAIDNFSLSAYGYEPHFVEMSGNTLIVSRFNGVEITRKTYTPRTGAGMTCCGVWGMTNNVTHLVSVLVFERY